MIYLDTSAFVKMVREEAGTPSLHRFLAERAGVLLVSSALLTVETRRAIQREDPSLLPRTDLLLTRVGRVEIGHSIIDAAGRLPGATLRSLDAIHLATALLLRDDLKTFLTYDGRLAAAAADQGLPVAAPGD